MSIADKLRHYDNIYYDNMRFVCKHLETMAGLVEKYEGLGYELIIEANTSENGSVRVFLKPKEWLGNMLETKVYETYWVPGERRQKKHDDPYPTEEKISELFESAISRIEAIKENKLGQQKKMEKAA